MRAPTRPDRVLGLVSILAILSLVASCQQTSSSLRDEAEAQLQAPGSTQLGAGGHDAMQTIEGHLAAIAWRQYGTDASWDDVVTYFDAELRNRGWQEGGCSSGFPSTDEWAVMAWHSDSRILRLGHLIDERAVKHDQQFVTVYAVALIGEGIDPGCPERRTPAVPTSN